MTPCYNMEKNHKKCIRQSYENWQSHLHLKIHSSIISFFGITKYFWNEIHVNKWESSVHTPLTTLENGLWPFRWVFTQLSCKWKHWRYPPKKKKKNSFNVKQSLQINLLLREIWPSQKSNKNEVFISHFKWSYSSLVRPITLNSQEVIAKGCA